MSCGIYGQIYLYIYIYIYSVWCILEYSGSDLYAQDNAGINHPRK